jgi:hypothetical protein
MSALARNLLYDASMGNVTSIDPLRSFGASLSLAAWFVTVGALAAQAPPPQTQPSLSEGSTVTMTGCLRAGEQPGTFLLANAKREATSSDGKDIAAHHGPGAKTDRPAPARGAETLRLAGATTRLKLSDHVGHTVSVTGMLAAEDRIVTPGIVLPDAPAGGAPGRKPEVGGKSPARVFNVRSVTHVAAECK